ncbi:hypothetical protein [Metapseudomonas otitidis]|uniref:Pyrroloquinoline quinone biosynthesis protein PqqE n=1 Tax=Metapseudomonas otitidis TaxID=319939 RepID=A0ABU3XXJ3_9GAMM|nr:MULTISPECIES: hypothetical protein [Pseudomonas]MDL5600126.1 hypothetical protein [Bacillus subtilis]MDG9783451.1 hypothetical protein [Pseudomonas otitidis]MDV3442416.1 hypothetical protein [Pseudomonas otitidis]MEE1894776.1 hypothetical protein [Pseudomonas otitidis]WMR33610.1 hypothetical protein QT513_02410 [Pseudomonas otitidis]
MEISGSALSYGLNALQSGQQRIDKAASDIASAPVQRSSDAPAARSQNSADESSSADLASNLVDLDVGKYQALAGAKVVKTADELLGTLVDTKA